MDKIVIDPQVFRRILNRNVIWPLIIGLLSATFFIAIVYYLLSISRWVENADLVIRKTNEVLKLCLDRETGLRGYVITGNEEFLEPYQRAKSSINPQIDEIRHLVDGNADQRARLDNIVLLSTRWLEYAGNIIALRNSNGDVGSGVRNGIGKKIMDDLRTDFSDFLLEEERIKALRYSSAKDTVYTLIGLFLLFSVLVATLLAYWGRRDLLYLSSTYGRVVQKQSEHAEFLQQQAWLRDGQAELANKVVGQLSLSTVCNNTLHFLCEYLDATVGAIYVVENDDKVLKRAATYAFSAEAQQRQQSFQMGESLVGQAAVERRLLQIQNVSGGYFQINSGLGATLPSSILVLPVAVDREVNAVVELGFARLTGARELDLLEQVAENIASMIAAANYRQRLQVVLWETQHLNDELQAQQEELRAANEELEDQARVVEEAQNRLELQHAELEQTNIQLEEQAAALELSRDTVEQKNNDLSHAHYLLEERAQELERASRYKSEFLANMSHELRTPLNSSLILSKLLAENSEGNLSPEQIKFAQSIYASGNDLLELINDILDISKVEAGKLEVRADNVALVKFVESMESLFRPLASEKGIDFSLELAADLPQTLFVDQKRLAQILKNLLSNAIKFTDRAGRVAVSVRRYSELEIAIIVKDSGIGIKEEYQQEIFEAFRQGDGATNRKYGGTGLGLSISRELTRLLGGSINVRSEPGKGSEFTLVIPCVYRDVTPILPRRQSSPLAVAGRNGSAVKSGDQTPRFVPPSFADDREHLSSAARTILIIEDEPQFAEILYDLARQQQFNCLVASGADQGFDTALR
ncbi:MAG TPA: CHASE3 domain-containing protein, partial [Spongiibacteraceae bacterium]|nr:CHASE3 domain-containing protein [Spongiibacteraceae bacterium]